METDALIIGAGPAGTASAILLASAGWNVTIVEKQIFPRRKVCGEYISATSLPLLKHLGIDVPFRARAGPEVRRVGLFAQECSVTSNLPCHDGEFGRALGREWLDTLLLERAIAYGAHCRQPC